MSLIDPKKGALIARLGLDLALGDRTDAYAAARELTDMATDLVPVDQLKAFLSERERNWADEAADVAEAVKLDAK